jgi:probable HAF family extracellular repeat protein
MKLVKRPGPIRALCVLMLLAVSTVAMAELPNYRVTPVMRPVRTGDQDILWYSGGALNNHGTMVVRGTQYGNPFAWYETVDKYGSVLQWLGGQSKYGSAYFSGINNWGDVAGSATHDWGVMRGTVVKDQGFGALVYGFNEDQYGGYYSDAWAYGLSDSGHVVGQATGSLDGRVRAYLWKDGVQQELGTFGGPSSSAVAVNNRGHAVGTADLPDGSYHAFIFRKGLMRDLGTLGGALSWASAINDAGQVVGGAQLADGSSRAFIYAKGLMTVLPTPEGAPASAWDINRTGTVLGAYTTDRSRPFLFDGSQLRNLEDLLTDAARARWTLTGAAAINDKGWILCSGHEAGDVHDTVLLLKPVAMATGH